MRTSKRSIGGIGAKLNPSPGNGLGMRRAPTFTVTDCEAPLRQISSFTSRPAGVSWTIRENCSIPSTRWPLYCRTTSPVLRPAFSAGLSGSTRVISTPASSRSLSVLARSLSISWIPTPMKLLDMGVVATLTWPASIPETANVETSNAVSIVRITSSLQLLQINNTGRCIDPQDGTAAIDRSFGHQRRAAEPKAFCANFRKIGKDAAQVSAGIISRHDRERQIRRNQNGYVARARNQRRILEMRAGQQFRQDAAHRRRNAHRTGRRFHANRAGGSFALHTPTRTPLDGAAPGALPSRSYAATSPSCVSRIAPVT